MDLVFLCDNLFLAFALLRKILPFYHVSTECSHRGFLINSALCIFYLKLSQVVSVKNKMRETPFPMPFGPGASSFHYYLLLIFFVLGDSLSEAGAGSVPHSDASQPSTGYSSEQMMGSQMISNISQAEMNVPGTIYPPQQLVGHYQQISGVR